MLSAGFEPAISSIMRLQTDVLLARPPESATFSTERCNFNLFLLPFTKLTLEMQENNVLLNDNIETIQIL
jgi:hypothetical protein